MSNVDFKGRPTPFQRNAVWVKSSLLVCSGIHCGWCPEYPEKINLLCLSLLPANFEVNSWHTDIMQCDRLCARDRLKSPFSGDGPLGQTLTWASVASTVEIQLLLPFSTRTLYKVWLKRHAWFWTSSNLSLMPDSKPPNLAQWVTGRCGEMVKSRVHAAAH
eukprot:1160268-Pelagomonas_calceolata.AAC.11